MITNKFQYNTLNRVDSTEGRKYADPNGNKLPSVTTILTATTPIEKKEALSNQKLG